MGWQRCYLSSGWAWQPGGLAIQPLHQAETAESSGMDVYLRRAKDYGINVLLCVHQTPEWYRPTGRDDGANDYAPIPKGARRDDPASFKDYASFIWQVCARYGTVSFPESELMVDRTPRWPGDVLNEKKTGLGLLTHIECWNEKKWWKNGTSEQEAYIEPETMAALMSACYDGHEGALGKNVGTKGTGVVNVMPGLEDYDFESIQKMDAWFRVNRKDKSWPCQIMNYHHYQNLGNRPKQHPAQWVNDGACLPAQDANFNSIVELVAFGKAMGKETWITETGADKRSPSQMTAKGVGKTDAQFQAEIIIASIEAYKKAGVDAVFIFTGPDEDGGRDGGQFETCGLFSSQETGYKPTPASEAVKKYLQETPPKSMQKKVAVIPEIKASSFKRPNK